VKEIAAVYVQPPAAQLPIGTQQKIIAKNPMLLVVLNAAADEAKVRHVLLGLT
jgi:hypothetical protein